MGNSLGKIMLVPFTLGTMIAGVFLYLDFRSTGGKGVGKPTATLITSIDTKRKAASSYLWTGVEMGAALYPNDALRTGAQGSARIQLADGQNIDIGPDTMITIDERLTSQDAEFTRGGILHRETDPKPREPKQAAKPPRREKPERIEAPDPPERPVSLIRPPPRLERPALERPVATTPAPVPTPAPMPVPVPAQILRAPSSRATTGAGTFTSPPPTPQSKTGNSSDTMTNSGRPLRAPRTKVRVE